MILDVMTPEGRFFTPLDPGRARHYVAFAAGSGITPVLSLARTALAREPKSRFTLVYGNRRLASTMFHEALCELKDRYLPRLALYHVFSREQQEVELFNGRIDAAKARAFLETLIPVDDIDEAFVCGPASMIDEVEGALLAAGVPRSHVHVERFGVPGATMAPVDDAEAAEARLTMVVDGVRREIDFHRSVVDETKCTGCGTCLQVCPYGALRKNEKGYAEVIVAACKGCGCCGATCPEGAITMTNYTDAQFLAEARAALEEGLQ